MGWFFGNNKGISKTHAEEIETLVEKITKLKEENKQLKETVDRYWNMYLTLKDGIINGVETAALDIPPYIINAYLLNMEIKYDIVYDGDYCRIISRQHTFTISYRREFDTTKDNYNWINEGEALITLLLDNVSYSSQKHMIIKAPAFGIFESDNNKMIKMNEEICRIRIYPKEEEQKIKEQLERDAIKKAVLKKERKKMIERETLDELIDEGKVFNVITAKDGNRTTIPIDVANAVWNRDGGRCCYCGSKKDLEFDHIIPVSKGGATTFRNLQLLCHDCNLHKSNNI